MTRYFLIAVAALLVCVASSHGANVLLDLNFDSSPYGTEGTALGGLVGPQGTHQETIGNATVDTSITRAGAGSMEVTTVASGNRYSGTYQFNSAVSDAIASATPLPLTFEYSLYRHSTEEYLRMYLHGGATNTAFNEISQPLDIWNNGDVHLYTYLPEGGGAVESVLDVTGNLTGWWDMVYTLNPAASASERMEYVSVTVTPPGGSAMEMPGIVGNDRHVNAVGDHWNGWHVYHEGAGGSPGTRWDEMKVWVVPEPSTLALLGVGALGLVVMAFRRRRRK